jgi:hypothetical protein
VTPLAIAALILAAVLGTFIIYQMNTPAVKATVSFVDRIRYVVGFLFLALGAWHLLRSGNVLYVLIAVLGFAFLTGYALVERPWKETI